MVLTHHSSPHHTTIMFAPTPYLPFQATSSQEAITAIAEGYSARMEKRARLDDMIDDSITMFLDLDFKDRLYLFMADLSELSVGQKVTDLPHHGLYFRPHETQKLAKMTRLMDFTATPKELFISFDKVFPIPKKLVDGVWVMNTDDTYTESVEEGGIEWIYSNRKLARPIYHGPFVERTRRTYLNWIRHQKECIPGTLIGIHAEENLRQYLESVKEYEIEEAEARRKAARRAKLAAAARERRREKNAANAATAAKSKKQSKKQKQKQKQSKLTLEGEGAAMHQREHLKESFDEASGTSETQTRPT
jgi:hypothetical protein